MDIFKYLSNMIVPGWVKATVIITLVSFVCVYFLVGYFGIRDYESTGAWIEAAAYVLGIILPIAIVSFVFLYSQTGERALRANVHRYLLTVLPGAASSLLEAEGKFLEIPTDRPVKRPVRTPAHRWPVTARVLTADRSNVVTYIFEVPENQGAKKPARRIVTIRVELNVWKINLNICIEQPRFDALCKSVDTQGCTHGWSALFPHTFEGALREGYQANPSPLFRMIEDKPFCCLVFSRDMKENFMFDDAQKLYLAQDIMLMLRSMIHEQPDAFEHVS